MARVAGNKEKISKSDKKKFKESFNKENLKMIKKLSKDLYPVSESDVKKLIKANKD